MANVSKNIRRLRTERGLTQAALAEKINVTRQTVSSWETGRTQPDIDMLELLSGALDAEIEALIYGKKRNVGLEDPARTKRRTMSVVLTVLGTLLTAVGLIVIFVYFWQDLGKYLRMFLAFLPLLVGAGAGLSALFCKKQGVVRRESAAVLWIAGVIASNALINAVFDARFGFAHLLAADIVLTLPVMFLLQSAAACVADYALTVIFTFNGGLFDFTWEDPLVRRLPPVLFAAATTAICLWFALKNRLPETAKKIPVGLSLLAVPFNAVSYVAALTTDADAGMVMLFVLAWCLSLYLADRTKKTGLPLRQIAGGSFGVALFLFFLFQFDGEEFVLLQSFWPIWLGLCLPALGFSLYYGRDRLREDRLRQFTAPVMALLAAVSLFAHGQYGIPQLLCSLLFGVLAVTAGIIRADLAAANFGILNIFAVLLVVLFRSDILNMLQIGGIILGAGVTLLLVNRMMLKKIAAKKAAEKEAAADETA